MWLDLQKNMVIEISLIYWLSLVEEHIFFFHLICTEYLLIRLQYIDFDEFLTGY